MKMPLIEKNVFSKRNNFDMMRIILALTVCVVHIYELSGLESLSFIPKILSSYVAVKCFFVISGFLIFMSYDRSENLASYFCSRFFRIFPAYIFVIVFSSILLTIIFNQISLSNITSVLTYIFWNMLFLNFMAPNIPGVFSDNEITAVNGALWTLKIEVMFYVSVPIIRYIMYLTNKNATLFTIYFLSSVYVYFFEYIVFLDREIAGELQRQMPGQMSYFIAGALLYYNFDKFVNKYIISCFVAVLTLVFSPDFLLPVVEPIAFGVITITIAYSIYFGPWARFGDFSYGLYIVHFPVVQTLVALGVQEKGGGVFAASALLLTGLISIGLWHGIEKRYLRRGGHRSEAGGCRGASGSAGVR